MRKNAKSLLLAILLAMILLPAAWAVDVIVDNDLGVPAYTETGTWTTSGSPGYNGGTYRYATAGGAHTAKWTAGLSGGNADVYVIYVAGTNRATSVKYVIHASDGDHIVYINQQTNNLVWVLLGTFPSINGDNWITVDVAGSTGGTVVIADAVKWVTGSATPTPTATPSPTPEGQEWRALWADAWHAGFKNTSEVTAMINRCKTYNYNVILPEIRLRGNCYYFPTYPNTEPRATDIASNYDPLQDIITQAHANGIQVHPWIVLQTVGTAGSPPSSPAHVINAHPEYLTKTSGGSVLTPDYDLDTGNPNANLWNYNMIMDLVTNYDIDGIHYDHCRMHQQDSGYNSVSIARYNAEYGLTGQPASNNAQFITWRRRQLTNFLRATYVDIKAAKPNMIVTAALMPNMTDNLNVYFQDWPTWMQIGALDAGCPMNYTTDNNLFQTRLNTHWGYKYGRHLYEGLGNYLCTKETVVAQVGYCRTKGCEGVVFYSYPFPDSTGVQDSVFQYYKDTIFPSPANIPVMPWILTPTKGQLRGKVTDSSTGNPIDIATVTILGLAISNNTEGDGKYSFIDVTPGTYTVRCVKTGYPTNDIPNVTITAGAVATQNFVMGGAPTPTPTATPTPTPTPTATPTPTPTSTSTATPTPTATPTNKVYVYDIAMAKAKAGSKNYAKATVWIKNNSGANVSGATVTGQWSGIVSGTSSGTTGTGGTVILTSAKTTAAGTITFCVTNVVASGYTYDPALNVKTCNSIAVP